MGPCSNGCSMPPVQPAVSAAWRTSISDGQVAADTCSAPWPTTNHIDQAAASPDAAGGGSTSMKMKQYSAVLGLPIAFVYSVIPVTGALICFYAIAMAMGEEILDPEDTAQPGS